MVCITKIDGTFEVYYYLFLLVHLVYEFHAVFFLNTGGNVWVLRQGDVIWNFREKGVAIERFFNSRQIQPVKVGGLHRVLVHRTASYHPYTFNLIFQRGLSNNLKNVRYAFAYNYVVS